MNLINSEVKSLEDYASALVTSILSLKTLENFHLSALRNGILDEDEEELVVSISWELKRIEKLLRNQIANISEHVEINENVILEKLKKLVKEDTNDKRDN